ncbi:MAG: hypothetical protein KC983_12325 [Phycisphaerales bacterium]|nr:hypothetical protein [Phycisphaerales bacterium]
MKFFWSIMLLIGLGAAVMSLARTDRPDNDVAGAAAPASVLTTPMETVDEPIVAEAQRAPEMPDEAVADATPDATPDVTPDVTPDEIAEPAAERREEPVAESAPADPAWAEAPTDAPPATAFSGFVRTEHVAGHTGTATTVQNGTMTFEIPPTSAKILGGAGTKQNPYRITFDVLGLAYHTYRPSADLYEMPELVSSIDGDWISLTGYHIFPAAMSQVQEMLLTKTMWDGCCIGIPPSPYDGVEIKLAEPIDPAILRSSPIATVQGRLRIDPYLHDHWLLSLYIIEDARIIPEL